MEQTIHDFLILVGRIVMVPVTVMLVAAVILVPAAGLKKILGEVWAEHKQPPTKSS